MTWNWESFPEYLDALEKLPRTVDVATHVPHGAVRAYVMGERGARNEPPTATDIARMSQIVEEGLRAGALGFSTSRTILHKSIDGELVPGTTATKDELIGIGRAMGRVGYGVFEMVSDLRREWNEFEWMGALSRETGLPITFAALQSIAKELSARRADRGDGAGERQGRQHRRPDRAARQRHRDGVARDGASFPLQAGVGRDRRAAVGRAARAAEGPGVSRPHDRRGNRCSRNPTWSALLQIVASGWSMQYAMGPDVQLRADGSGDRSWRAQRPGASAAMSTPTTF